MYLLDTNIISDLVHNPEGRTADRLSKLKFTSVVTSTIVVAEIEYGLAKKSSPKLTARTRSIIRRLNIVSFEPPADVIYGEIRAHLERKGSIIGGVDLFIAAHSLALEAILVTANEREFSKVPDLIVENWLR
jgi:tRNA(fMet)-specific endonuclease VapC